MASVAEDTKVAVTSVAEDTKVVAEGTKVVAEDTAAEGAPVPTMDAAKM